MTQHTIQTASSQGLVKGTQVMTLAGVIPVEKLMAGDKIVTRTGARPLRKVAALDATHFALEFDRPQVVYLMDGQVHGETGLPFAA